MKCLPLFPLLLLCLCLLLSGCSAAEETTVLPENEISEQSETPVPATPETIQQTEAGATLVVYYGDENCENLISQRILVPEEQIRPEQILTALYEKGVFSEAVTVESFHCDGNRITLDLSESFATMVRKMGTSGEYIMLGSLVNSFLDAYDAESLTLTVEGNALETGHNIYDYPLQFYR